MEYSYRFRLYPTARQKELMAKTFGCCRFVYNYYLSKRIDSYKNTGKGLSYVDCSKDMTMLKKSLPWISEVDATALQSSLKNLDAAYQNFFRGIRNGQKVGFPQFKAKHFSEQSFKSKNNNGSIAVAGNFIKLPKLGYVPCRVSKKVRGIILSATVRKTSSGKYFVSICCKDVDIQHLPSTGAMIGIDLGLKNLVITSDGETYDNPKTYCKNQKKLARLQRQLSRKTKGSANREKAKLKVARLHEKIANQRNDAIHKMTTQLVRGNDVICIEDLAVKDMVRNRHLSKSIMDAAWGEIRRQLTYKCNWYGRKLVVIDRFYPSSQTCSHCGYQNSKTKNLGVRFWVCPNCGTEHDRDVNAANMILQEGLRVLGVPA